MIKGIIRNKDNKNLLILGLSDLNIERLRSGKDIYASLDKLGLPNVSVLITHGAVEEDIVTKLHETYGFEVTTETDVTGPYKPEPTRES